TFPYAINGAYTITPYSAGVGFSPSAQSVTISGSSSQSGVNFTKGGTVPALIQYVQTAGDIPYHVSYNSPVTKGDFLMAVGLYTALDTPTVSDSQGNTWTLLTNA